MRHPAISETWAGIRRSKGTMQQGKAPAVTADIKAMVAELPDTLRGVRDRALLLVGFSGAFRRSELVAVDVDDCEFTRDGLVITLRRSKTDQDGAGRKVGLPYGSNPATCPIRSLQAWLEVAGIEDAPGVPVHSQGRAGAGRPVEALERGEVGEPRPEREQKTENTQPTDHDGLLRQEHLP